MEPTTGTWSVSNDVAATVDIDSMQGLLAEEVCASAYNKVEAVHNFCNKLCICHDLCSL